jgi:hypothetical protein
MHFCLIKLSSRVRKTFLERGADKTNQTEAIVNN